MAVAATKVKHGVWGDRRAHTYTLVFSSNYATGGEAVTAADFGLQYLEDVILHGAALAADEATGLPCAFDSTGSKIVFLEGSAAGTALSEKTNAEVYPTGLYVRATALGW